jgi:hypothetical protein
MLGVKVVVDCGSSPIMRGGMENLEERGEGARRRICASLRRESLGTLSK